MRRQYRMSAAQDFRLAQVCRMVSGGTPSKGNPEYWGGDVPWVTAKDMKGFELTSSGLCLTERGAEKVWVAPTECVLVLVRGMQLLRSLPVCVNRVRTAFNQDVKALIPNANVRARYLAWALRAQEESILGQVDTAGHGTRRLASDILGSIRIRVPSLREQDRMRRLARARREQREPRCQA